MKRRLGLLVIALLVALAGAWVGAFAGSRIGLEFAPDLPSGAAAERLSGTAFPGLRVFGGGNAPAIEPFGDGEGVKYGSVGYWVKHTEETRDVAAYTAGARERLAADGWRIHDFGVDPPEALIDGGDESSAGFWATRDGLVLSFADYYWTGRPAYDSTGAAAFDLWRAPPPWLHVATWAGAIAGALLGLLLTLWVGRRAPGGPVLATGAVVAVLLLLPSTLRPGAEQPMDSPWFGGFYHLGRAPATLSAMIAAAILLFAVAQYPWVRSATAFVAGPARRRPKVFAVIVVVALVAAILRVAGYGYPPCHPTGVPAEPAADRVRDSTHVKIFVASTATDQERALVDAAIFRSRAGSLGELIWQPDSAGFRETYCGGGRVPESAVASLPYYFDLDLANPATYPALLEEVNGLAGVVAVRRAT